MKKNLIIVISGPTATGKTSTSIEIAKRYNAEIVNFDSLLFYTELNIGTAKPTEEEKAGIPHHMVDITSIKTPLNAAQYIKLAVPIINDCHQRDKVVILVGGSGFYLQALLKGMYNSKTSTKEVQERSQALYDSSGITPFRDILKAQDPESYERYHQNDHYRIRRACEHFWTTNIPFSKSREEGPKKEESPEIKYNWNVLNNYIDIPKDEHALIIESRTNKMLKEGLINEVQSLLQQDYNPQLKPLLSIGYKETIDFIQGNFSSETEYIDKINTNTRRLAKSQRTWFKKKETHNYHSLTEKNLLLQDCDSFIKKNIIK